VDDVVLMPVSIPDVLALAPSLNISVFVEEKKSARCTEIGTVSIALEAHLVDLDSEVLDTAELISHAFGMGAYNAGVIEIPQWMKKKYLFEGETETEPAAQTLSFGMRVLSAISTAPARADREASAALSNEDEHPVTNRNPVARKWNIGSFFFGLVTRWVLRMVSSARDALTSARSAFCAAWNHGVWSIPDVAWLLGVRELREPDQSGDEIKGGNVERLNVANDATLALRGKRGYSDVELEVDFAHGMVYQEFGLFRGEETVDVNNAKSSEAVEVHPNLTALHGGLQWGSEAMRVAVGQLKMRFDLVNLQNTGDSLTWEKSRLAALRAYKNVFSARDMIVRIHVLRALDLVHSGSVCNPCLAVKILEAPRAGDSKRSLQRFTRFTTRATPLLNTAAPLFFETFESRVRMPGALVRIEVKERTLPSLLVPTIFPWYVGGNTTGENKNGAFELRTGELLVDFSKAGISWSNLIGYTTIDLDQRWYNPLWRSLEVAPVEMRSLWLDDTPNERGKLEVILELAEDPRSGSAHFRGGFGRESARFEQRLMARPQRLRFQLRVVVFRAWHAYLPYKMKDDPTMLANFFVALQIGNNSADQRRTDVCPRCASGSSAFNWRVAWWLELPSSKLKSRLKLQLFHVETNALLSGDLFCGAVDLTLADLFGRAVLTNSPQLYPRQRLTLSHPNDVTVRPELEIAIEIVPEREVGRKLCGFGERGYDLTQHEDYILPRPKRAAAFSLRNPMPSISHQVSESAADSNAKLAIYLLPFPIVPLVLQLVARVPWQCYAIAGALGLVVMVRVVLVQLERAMRLRRQQLDEAQEDLG